MHGNCRPTSSIGTRQILPKLKPQIRMRHLPLDCQFPRNTRLAEVLPAAGSCVPRAVDGDSYADGIGCSDLSDDAPP
jgi:hypothetical protein